MERIKIPRTIFLSKIVSQSFKGMISLWQAELMRLLVLLEMRTKFSGLEFLFLNLGI